MADYNQDDIGTVPFATLCCVYVSKIIQVYRCVHWLQAQKSWCRVVRRTLYLQYNIFTCAPKCDDGYRDEGDAVWRRGREGVASDITGGNEEQDEERQDVADGDAHAQTQFLDQNIAQHDADERRTDVRQAHVKYDRRRRVLGLNADTCHHETVASWQGEQGKGTNAPPPT